MEDYNVADARVLDTGDYVQLQVVVPPSAHQDLPAVYGEATLDGTTFATTGVTIDAHWRLHGSEPAVYLVLVSQQPRKFSLRLRFDLNDWDWYQLLGTLYERYNESRHVGLIIYPARADLQQAQEALKAGDDALLYSLGIGIESRLNCKVLRRLEGLQPHREPPTPEDLRDPVSGALVDTELKRQTMEWWFETLADRLGAELGRTPWWPEIDQEASRAARGPLVFHVGARVVTTSLGELARQQNLPVGTLAAQLDIDVKQGIFKVEADGSYTVEKTIGNLIDCFRDADGNLPE